MGCLTFWTFCGTLALPEGWKVFLLLHWGRAVNPSVPLLLPGATEPEGLFSTLSCSWRGVGDHTEEANKLCASSALTEQRGCHGCHNIPCLLPQGQMRPPTHPLHSWQNPPSQL